MIGFIRTVLMPLSACVVVVACSSGQDGSAGGTGGGTAGDAGTAQSVAELGTALAEAMGGLPALESIETLTLIGNGNRTRMGQIAETGGQDPMGQIRNVTESIDLAGGRAAFDYDIVNGDFTQHRTEVLTKHQGQPVGWATGPGRPNIATSVNGIFSWATQNSPAMLLRRNAVTVALAAANTSNDSPAESAEFNGISALHGTVSLPSGEAVDVYVDADTGLLAGFRALDTETMLGDLEAEYALGDYRPVTAPGGDVLLPHSTVITKGGQPYSTIGYLTITANDPAPPDVFGIPEDAIGQADEVVASNGAWAPLAWNEVAAGTYHAVGYSHHSMVVEFDDFVAVVEGPYTEAQSLTLGRTIENKIGKPIRYVAPTHPHYDHTGGIRGLAALGATVLVAGGHEAELRGIVEAGHTNPPDELARRRSTGEATGAVEVFNGTTTIESGGRRLELYEIATIPHVNPMVIAFVRDAGVLFQSDLFFGGASPDAVPLYEAVEALGLEVETIVGGHGSTWPYASLVEAASGN